MYTISSRLVLFLSAAILAVGALFAAPLFASAHGDSDNAFKKGAHSVGSTLEVSINDNNSVTVRGAKVTSISGTTLNAQTAFGSTVLSWSIRTGTNTKIIALPGGTLALASIAVGDYVSFSGTLDTSAAGLVVNANVVKDWSQTSQKPASELQSFKGSVQSVDVSNRKFTLQTGGAEGLITVQLATTSVITNGADSMILANLVVGDSAKTSGTYNANAKILVASKVSVERKDSDGHKTFKGFFQSLADRFNLHLNFKK
jgi:hypothetical protein